MRLKLRAALDARRDPEFVVFARTDALAVEGVDAAIERARNFAEEGADVCFVEGPTSLEQLRQIPREVDTPLLANMLTGGVTPIVPFAELELMGYKIAVCPIAGLLAMGSAIRQLTESTLRSGRVDATTSELMTFEEVKTLLGVWETLNLRRRLES
jgi:2-methylisocitrate lyase-like PEP mutase family enzyme